jgi:Histidine kinase-, DNA gyrase B-, and HSP90-like ATPase
LAKIAIDAAIHQTNDMYDWTQEMVKNSFEAGATMLAIKAHQTTGNSVVIEWTDNGRGMGPKEIEALKIPGHSSKSVMGHEDINFGQGFWSAFYFNEILVTTSCDGKKCTQILFKKNNGATFF